MWEDALEIVSVVIDRQLEQMDPAAYSFLPSFARDNELNLRPGRKRQRPDEVATEPRPSP